MHACVLQSLRALQQKLHFVGVKKYWSTNITQPPTLPATPSGWPFPLWGVDPKFQRTARSYSQAVAAWLAGQVAPASVEQQQRVGLNFDELTWSMVGASRCCCLMFRYASFSYVVTFGPVSVTNDLK
jgi:hypothetical protein